MENTVFCEGLLVELIFPKEGKNIGYGARVYRRGAGNAEKCRPVMELHSQTAEPEEFKKLLSCCVDLRPSPCPIPVSG